MINVIFWGIVAVADIIISRREAIWENVEEGRFGSSAFFTFLTLLAALTFMFTAMKNSYFFTMIILFLYVLFVARDLIVRFQDNSNNEAEANRNIFLRHTLFKIIWICIILSVYGIETSHLALTAIFGVAPLIAMIVFVICLYYIEKNS